MYDQRQSLCGYRYTLSIVYGFLVVLLSAALHVCDPSFSTVQMLRLRCTGVPGGVRALGKAVSAMWRRAEMHTAC